MNASTPLFNLNGWFGCTASAQPEFPQATDLIAHMDRLGIGRSLVWHAAARDLHANTGNRRLLDEIGTTGGAVDRLVPAFTLAPSMLYERDGSAALIDAVRARRVRALRLFPATLRHRFDQIAPVIEKVAAWSPLLVCDVRESPQLHEVIELADRFPQLPIVLAQAMWPHLPTLLDSMRRRGNILCDISWLHSNATIELICRTYGSHRVLFGLGFRSHHGASIAALAHARITEEEREQIAHGNLDRLLGLSATRPHPSGLSRDPRKPLWNAFLEGRPLDTAIVDAHGHLGPSSLWMLENQEIRDQAPQAIADMDRCGIRTMIASGMDALFSDPVSGNERLAEEVRRYGERFRGWVVFNPLYASQLEPRLDSFFADPFFVGFKLLNDYWRVPVTDPRLRTVWNYAHEHRLPILLHTWDGPFDTPSLLREIAPAHPGAAFILGHAGGGDGGRREAEELALANHNVTLEWCGSFTTAIPWEQTLARVGPQRVVFGTDSVAHGFAWELGRLLSLDAPDEVLRPILGDNLRAILARRTGRA